MTTKWAFFKRYDIVDGSNPEKVYLTRWRLLQTPWFGIFLHKLNRPDSDRALHDHPWNFVSLILKGGYDEKRPCFCGWKSCEFSPITTTRSVGSFAYRKAEDLHAIVKLWRIPTWTLIIIGRHRRDWGFQTEKGWVSHDKFINTRMTEK